MVYIARRCTARRKDGRPCRAWAVRNSQLALCASHQHLAPADEDDPPDFYQSVYTLEEMADLIYQTEEKHLKDELRVTRVMVRRVLTQLKQEMERAEFNELIGLFFRGAQTIAGIMRAQRSISNKTGDQLPPAIGRALSKVGKKYDLDL